MTCSYYHQSIEEMPQVRTCDLKIRTRTQAEAIMRKDETLGIVSIKFLGSDQEVPQSGRVDGSGPVLSKHTPMVIVPEAS